MANRNKNGTKFSPDVRRGRRVKGSLSARVLQQLATVTRIIAKDSQK